ncbi:MAG: hypothetical protein ACOCWB_05945 [Bacteroidota bacterium]
MKKMLSILFCAGFLFSCSGENSESKKSHEITDKQQEQVEKTKNSAQEIEEIIESSENEIKETQSEIDSLLNNI